MKAYRSMIALGLLAGATAAPQAALAEDTIKIGLLATLEGAFTVLGQDSMRGADLAFKEANYMDRRQEDRSHQGLVRRLARQRRQGRAQAR